MRRACGGRTLNRSGGCVGSEAACRVPLQADGSRHCETADARRVAAPCPAERACGEHLPARECLGRLPALRGLLSLPVSPTRCWLPGAPADQVAGWARPWAVGDRVPAAAVLACVRQGSYRWRAEAAPGYCRQAIPPQWWLASSWPWRQGTAQGRHRPARPRPCRWFRDRAAGARLRAAKASRRSGA